MNRDAKYAKPQVHYRLASALDRVLGRQCGACSMWREGSCTAVAGKIHRRDVCDIFKRRR